MPLMSAAQTRMELSSRQRARCQTTGPVSSRPEDRWRATWLRKENTPENTGVHASLPSTRCVCVSYSQYHSLGLCTGEGQVLFSWVLLATKTPLTLQNPERAKKTDINFVIIIAEKRRSSVITTVRGDGAPAGVLLQLLSAQMEHRDHGRGYWKEANM